MRNSLIPYALERGIEVIGQVRRNTALFELPEASRGRGRPRKYGEKMTAEKVALLPEARQQFYLYGALQMVHYRTAIVKDRFLDGRVAHDVWIRFENYGGTLSPLRLLVCTDTMLSAARAILTYGKRWSIEDLFNQRKNRLGWKDAWQQSRQVLHRWPQILATSYALPQLLVLLGKESVKHLVSLSPWRRDQPITAGRVRQGLAMIFRNVDSRAPWNPKFAKFCPPGNNIPAATAPQRRKAARL